MAGVELVALGWLWWLAWSPLVARGAAPLCVAGVALDGRSVCMAGVALRDIDVPLAWQAWHLLHLAGSGGALGRR